VAKEWNYFHRLGEVRTESSKSFDQTPRKKYDFRNIEGDET